MHCTHINHCHRVGWFKGLCGVGCGGLSHMMISKYMMIICVIKRPKVCDSFPKHVCHVGRHQGGGESPWETGLPELPQTRVSNPLRKLDPILICTSGTHSQAWLAKGKSHFEENLSPRRLITHRNKIHVSLSRLAQHAACLRFATSSTIKLCKQTSCIIGQFYNCVTEYKTDLNRMSSIKFHSDIL